MGPHRRSVAALTRPAPVDAVREPADAVPEPATEDQASGTTRNPGSSGAIAGSTSEPKDRIEAS